MATNEFTKKLRAAIKTKIQELGIEVDDELPDYIMIMIANKKDKMKMKNDLMLFLSDNTDPFVDWLFEFFEKVNKKENEEAKVRETVASVKQPEVKKRHSSEERRKSRSRSPVNRRSKSRSPRRTRRDEEKPKRAPIRAPSPRHERSSRRDDRRRRSRSPEDDRRSRRREDRKKITYSDDEDEPHRTVRSHVVPARAERSPPSPKLASQVVVQKRRRAEPDESKAASSLFKRAMTGLREDEPHVKHRRREGGGDVLQVNSLRASRRTITADGSDISEEEEPERETQFIVRLGKKAVPRKAIIRASMDEAPPGDENYVNERALKRKRRVDDNVMKFLRLSGMQKNNGGVEDVGKLKRIIMLPPGTNVSTLPKHWDGKIQFDDDDEEDESDEEAEIDAFLATAHDSRIPPTEALSRPLQYVVPQKKQFGVSKPPEVGKIAERCKFWPKCRNEEACLYSHPSKPCINFPNCWFGDKCMFIHPQCKFEPNCSKQNCPYTHTLPRPPPTRPTAQPRQPAVNGGADASKPEPMEEQTSEETTAMDTDAKTEASGETKPTESELSDGGGENKMETSQTSGDGPDITLSAPPKPTGAASTIKPLNLSLHTTATSKPPTSNVMCRFGDRCHNEACSFRHSKKCRYDEACTNESCYFWHPKKNATRFRWVKT